MKTRYPEPRRKTEEYRRKARVYADRVWRGATQEERADKREANRKWRQRNSVWSQAKRTSIYQVILAAKAVPCMDCGGTFDPVCMDFDHRVGEEKLFGMSKAGHRGIGTVLAEIAKCDVVCANCHRIRTHRTRNHKVVAGQQSTAQTVIDLPGFQ